MNCAKNAKIKAVREACVLLDAKKAGKPAELAPSECAAIVDTEASGKLHTSLKQSGTNIVNVLRVTCSTNYCCKMITRCP